jgi:hypothetical protein
MRFRALVEIPALRKKSLVFVKKSWFPADRVLRAAARSSYHAFAGGRAAERKQRTSTKRHESDTMKRSCSGAMAARATGDALYAHSEGPDRRATFLLELPSSSPKTHPSQNGEQT